MATRANIKIKHGESNLWLYRHWDGYPEGAGLDLLEKIKTSVEFKYNTGGKLLGLLLSDKDENGESRYELRPEEMGGTEWLYDIEVVAGHNRNGSPSWATGPMDRDVISMAIINEGTGEVYSNEFYESRSPDEMDFAEALERMKEADYE